MGVRHLGGSTDEVADFQAALISEWGVGGLVFEVLTIQLTYRC